MLRRAVVFLLPLAVAAAPAEQAGPVLSGLKALESQPYSGTAKVVEIRGEHGEPEPKEWVFIFSDSAARGGVREVTLAGGAITAERTPLRASADVAGLAPIDTRAVGADADAVFRAAQNEAVKSRLGFDWIDFTLRADPESKEPVWTAKLYDRTGAPVGTVKVSAKDGAAIGPLQPDASARAAATPPSGERGLAGDIGRTLERAAKSTKDSTLHLIGTVQEKVTGERTVGPKDDE